MINAVSVLGVCAILSPAVSVSILPSKPSLYYDYSHVDNDGKREINVDCNENEYDYDYIPWQQPPSNIQNIDEAARYEDLPPSVFSPTGRLHPVEAAARSSKTATPLSNVIVAMRCREGLLVISTLPISPHVDSKGANIAPDANMTHANTTESFSSSSNIFDIGIECDTTDGVHNASNPLTTNKNVNVGESNDSLYPSLFLFEETCTSSMTGPIFDIHPCLVGATAGNAVDNRIMRTKLLALGLNAFENQGEVEEDITASSVAKDLANQLQVVTQDIAAAQKQKHGRLLASSAVIMGSRKIWRIDPTGQFWDCEATVIGEDADRTEEELYLRLLEECQNNQFDDVRDLLDFMSQTQALVFLKDFLETRLIKERNLRSQKLSMDTNSSRIKLQSPEKKIQVVQTPHFSPRIYWQAVILDYSASVERGTPRRKLKRGIFGVRNEV